MVKRLLLMGAFMLLLGSACSFSETKFAVTFNNQTECPAYFKFGSNEYLVDPYARMEIAETKKQSFVWSACLYGEASGGGVEPFMAKSGMETIADDTEFRYYRDSGYTDYFFGIFHP